MAVIDVREAARRALRDRARQVIDCFEPVLCDDGEPPRVVVAFVVGADGRTSEARAAEVTRFVHVGDAVIERSGDLDGPLARCLVEIVEGLSVDWRGEPRTIRYPFRPDVSGCDGPGTRIRRLRHWSPRDPTRPIPEAPALRLVRRSYDRTSPSEPPTDPDHE
ncbi:MAG: hypothetical protein KC619_08800 [Myxococcales bacterium]|nr:hypothetical protein [Myxococcales bacterium]